MGHSAGKHPRRNRPGAAVASKTGAEPLPAQAGGNFSSIRGLSIVLVIAFRASSFPTGWRMTRRAGQELACQPQVCVECACVFRPQTEE